MGDASILSHEYRRASELSDVVTRALVEIKKQVRGEKGGNVGKELAILSAVLRTLAAVLETPPNASPEAALARVERALLPQAMVERIRADQGGTLSYFVDDLRVAADAVDRNEVTSDLLRVLEAVADAADDEASRVFRRMLRK